MNVQNRLPLLFALLLIISFSGCEDPTLVLPEAPIWERTYGTEGLDVGNSIEALPADQGFLIAGATKSLSTGLYDILLIKTDNDGNEQARKTIGTSGRSEVAWHIVKRNGGNYTLLASEHDQDAVLQNVVIYEIDSDLNILQEQRNELEGYGYYDAEFNGSSFFQKSDGGYFLGWENNNRPTVFIFDADGVFLSSNLLSDYWVPESAHFVSPAPNGRFVMVVKRGDYQDVVGLKLNASGQVESASTIAITNNAYEYGSVMALSPTMDNQYFGVFHAEYSTEIQLILLDSNLNLNQNITFSASNGYNLIAPVDSTHFVLGGSNYAENNYSYSYYGGYGIIGNCFSADVSLPLDFNNAGVRGGDDEDRIMDFAVSASGKVAFVGSTASYGEGAMDVYLFFE